MVAPDYACHDDDGQDVRRRLQELGRQRRVDKRQYRLENLHLHLQGVGKAEEEGSYEAADGVPVAEDHGRQRHEPLTSCHGVLEGSHLSQREVVISQKLHHLQVFTSDPKISLALILLPSPQHATCNL